MFKKNITISQKHPISGKARKKIRKDIESQLDIGVDSLRSTFSDKIGVDIVSLSNKAKCLIFDGEVLFLDPNGKEDNYVPTVYFLWKVPDALPIVHTWGPVSPKILNGADLFLQGVAIPASGEMPDLKVGDLVSVGVVNNIYPFAVGVAEFNTRDLPSSGMKGRGIKILHTYGDLLWGLGDKSVPDPTFTLKGIEEMDQSVFDTKLSEYAAAKAAAESQESVETVVAGNDDVSMEAAEKLRTLKVEEKDGADVTQMSTPGDSQVADTAAADNTPGSPSTVMDFVNYEAVAEYCLTSALAKVKTSELPIMTSSLYSQYMVPSKPQGCELDLKKTHYKKLSKLLQAFEKKGLLHLKTKFKNDYVSAVERGSPAFSAAILESKKFIDDLQSVAGGAAGAPAAGAQRKVGSFKSEIVYRIPPTLQSIYVNPVGPTLYTSEEFLEAFDDYVMRNDLYYREGAEAFPPLGGGIVAQAKTEGRVDPKRITLNTLLTKTCFNKSEGAQVGNPIATSDIKERLISKLTKFHRCSRLVEGKTIEVVSKGEPTPLLIKLVIAKGKRQMTVLQNYQRYGVTSTELGSLMKKKFQTAATVQKQLGTDADEIHVHGNFMKEVSRVLQAEFDLEAQYISVQN